MDDDDLDVALDAWMRGTDRDAEILCRLGIHDASGLVALATRAYTRGCPKEATALYESALVLNPRVLLRGRARVLARRTRDQLRAEAADLMQWDARTLRVGYSLSPSAWIRTPWGTWRAWWTEEDAIAEAIREAWRRIMRDEIEEAAWTGERVSRSRVDAHARDTVDRLQAGIGIGELLGQPGPLRMTASGFVIVPAI